MEFTDTHCHIHESALFPPEDKDDAVRRAVEAGVTNLLLVGTNVRSSIEAIEMAGRHAMCHAVVGVHPHDSKDGVDHIGRILKDSHDTVVGVGEIGLDYFYDNSPREIQIAALERQLQWAKDYGLPVSFHVREAFDDFWPVFANFPGLKGVLHSYTDSTRNLEKALGEGLFIGVNGISTFSQRNQENLDVFEDESGDVGRYSARKHGARNGCSVLDTSAISW